MFPNAKGLGSLSQGIPSPLDYYEQQRNNQLYMMQMAAADRFRNSIQSEKKEEFNENLLLLEDLC